MRENVLFRSKTVPNRNITGMNKSFVSLSYGIPLYFNCNKSGIIPKNYKVNYPFYKENSLVAAPSEQEWNDCFLATSFILL
jgi:hypothetical protein